MAGTARSSRRHSVDVSRTLAMSSFSSSSGGGGGHHHHRQSMDDPFARLTRAPTHETAGRTRAAARARGLASRRNREIDEGLAETKKALERRDVRSRCCCWARRKEREEHDVAQCVLDFSWRTRLQLLMHLVRTDFQLTFAPSQFHAERSAWRYVIQLNLVQSVRVILDVLNAELDPATPLSPALPHRANSVTPRLPLPTSPLSPSSFSSHPPLSSSIRHAALQMSLPKSTTETNGGGGGGRLTNDHRKLILRLGALLAVEPLLQACIDPDYAARSVLAASMPLQPCRTVILPPQAPLPSPCAQKHRGSSSCALARAGSGSRRQRDDFRGTRPRRLGSRRRRRWDEPTAVLSACREDVMTLWNDEVVREILKRRGVDVEHMPGLCVFA